MEKSKKTWSFQEVLPDLKVIMEMFLCVPDERLFSFIQAVRLGPVVYASFVLTGRNEVVAKVMFLHLSVILFTGGSASVHAGIPPPSPEARTPLPRSTHPPGSTHPHLPGSTHPHPPGSTHPPPGSRLRHTVNERPVRILLECILVLSAFRLFMVLSPVAVASRMMNYLLPNLTSVS